MRTRRIHFSPCLVTTAILLEQAPQPGNLCFETMDTFRGLGLVFDHYGIFKPQLITVLRDLVTLELQLRKNLALSVRVNPGSAFSQFCTPPHLIQFSAGRDAGSVGRIGPTSHGIER